MLKGEYCYTRMQYYPIRNKTVNLTSQSPPFVSQHHVRPETFALSGIDFEIRSFSAEASIIIPREPNCQQYMVTRRVGLVAPPGVPFVERHANKNKGFQ